MLVAVLGDIHGNLPALDAARKLIDEIGILTVINTGDIATGYPWPNEVIDAVQRHRDICVQGHWDRQSVRMGRSRDATARRMDEAAFASITWTHNHLTSAHREWLASLPRIKRVRLEGIDLCAFHGTPTSQTEHIDAELHEARMERIREDTQAGIVISGASHTPFHRWVHDTLFVNPGSVGLANAGPGIAEFAIINTETQPWTVEHHTVSYDADAVERACHDAGIPDPRICFQP